MSLFTVMALIKIFSLNLLWQELKESIKMMLMNFITLKNSLIRTLFIITNFLTSPQKTGAFKSREFGDELLILKGRKK